MKYRPGILLQLNYNTVTTLKLKKKDLFEYFSEKFKVKERKLKNAK